MDVDVIRDPVTDQVRAYATVRERRNRLVVSCNSAEGAQPRVTFHSDRWMARGNTLTGFRPVIHRFDNRRPRRQMWHVENRHATLTGQRRIAAFLANLMVADRLVIRTRDIERHRLDLTFRLWGVRPAVDRAMSACTGRLWPAQGRRR